MKAGVTLNVKTAEGRVAETMVLGLKICNLLITNGKKHCYNGQTLADSTVTKQAMGQKQHTPPEVAHLKVHNVV